MLIKEETKEKEKLPEIKNQLQHIYLTKLTMTVPTVNCSMTKTTASKLGRLQIRELFHYHLWT